ncbi:MAG: hypothetical protein SGJ26_03670 [Nitrospirota bacterium]|nr:hypothetical protein [Nitrospirota bacterium]
MAFVPPAWGRQRSCAASLVLALLCLVGAACSTTDKNITILFDDPRGTVSLQAMPDQSVHATHPITLDPTLIAQILRGIAVHDQERGLQKILGGMAAPTPAFSDDQIQFLAPLLAEGLRTATPDQRIGYRVETTHKARSWNLQPRKPQSVLSMPMADSSTSSSLNIDIRRRGQTSRPSATWPIDRVHLILQASETVFCCSPQAPRNGPPPLIHQQGESRPTDFSLSILGFCNSRRQQQPHLR